LAIPGLGNVGKAIGAVVKGAKLANRVTKSFDVVAPKPAEVNPPVKKPSAPVKAPEPIKVPEKPVEVPELKPMPVSPPAPAPASPPVEAPPAPAPPKEVKDTVVKPELDTVPKTVDKPAPARAPQGNKPPGKADIKDRLRGRRRPDIGFGLPDSEDDKKELTPAKFGLKVKVNRPQGDVMTGVDKRMSNAYRKSFEASVKEEVTTTDDEEKKTGRRFFKPAVSVGSKVKVNTPKRAGVKTGVDARMSKYERDFYGQQNESIMSQIMTMVKEDVTEMQLNIGENTLKINNTIAKKVVGVYESLNKQNKKKMENMLNEGTTDSFMKLINFAVRQ
jgi:hypothetical protein